MSSHGLELFSGSLGAVLSQNSTVPYVIDSGYQPAGAGGVATLVRNLPASFGQAPCIVLARPEQADKYIGGFFSEAYFPEITYTSPPANPSFTVYAQCPFYWKVLAVTGAPITDSTSFGLEIYRSDSSIAYSSRRQSARLKQIVQVTAASVVNDEIYVPISGFSARPWLVMNDLPSTVSGIGEFSEFYPFLMAKVNAANTGVYISWRDGGGNFRKLDSSNSDFGQYNTFFYGPNYFVSLYDIPEV